MIISASRRTDIPAYYSDWFLKRLQEGYLLVPNPYNAKRLTRLPLTPEQVDCIVFWSKDPSPMLGKLDAIKQLGYPFYFQFTLTGYGSAWESGLPSMKARIETLCALSEKIGKERVVWRYDPILVDETFSEAFHAAMFHYLCERLSPYVDGCIFSFIDQYAHAPRGIPAMENGQMRRLAKLLADTARPYGLALSTCCETIDLTDLGISHASCIDKGRIEKLLGCPIACKKDVGQRPGCGCMESVDIGTYNTCLNGCQYCYATRSQSLALKNHKEHDPSSPLLIGWPKGDEMIKERSLPSFRLTQTSLF